MREKLWNLLDKTRFEYNYFQEYHRRLLAVRFTLKSVEGIVLVVLVGGFADIFYIPIFGQMMALLLGVLAVIYEQSMLNQKLVIFDYFLPELAAHLRKLQSDWHSINYLYEYDDRAIAEMIAEYSDKIELLMEKYTDKLYIPKSKKLIEKASTVTA